VSAQGGIAMLRCSAKAALRPRCALVLAAVGGLAAGAWQPPAAAQSGTWTAAAGTTAAWGSAANWSGGVVADGAGNRAVFTNNGTVTLDSNRTLGALAVVGTGTRVIDGAGAVLTLASGTGEPMISGTTGSTLGITAVLAGTQGLRKSGTANLLLANANTFSGTAMLQTGTTIVTNLAGLGASGVGNETVVASGAQVRIQVSGVVPESFTLSGRGNPTNAATGGGGVIRVSGNAVTLTGVITLSGSAEVFPDSTSSLTLAGRTTGTGGFIFRPGSGGGITVTGNLEQTGYVNRWSGGTGMLTLSGSNSYAGSTSFDSGNTMLDNPHAIPVTSRLSVTPGGNVDLNGNDITIPSFGWRDDLVNAGSFSAADSSGGSIFDNSAAPGTTTIAVTSGTFVLGTAINDGTFGRRIALSIAGVDQSMLQLTSQSSSFSGGLTLAHGPGRGTRLTVQDPLVNGGSPGAIASSVFGTGTVTVGLTPTDKVQFYVAPGTYASGTGSTILNDVVFNTAVGCDSPGAVLLNVVESTFAGTVVSDRASASFVTGAIVTDSVAVLTGRVTSTGPDGGLWLRDSGQTPGVTVRLANQTASPNDYQGATIVEANTTLALGAADQVPNGGGRGNLEVAGRFSLGGFSDTLNGLSGSGVVDGAGGAPTLTVGDGDATATFSGTIGNSAGTLSLVKIGAGVQTLSGGNTLTGSTVVQQGTLRLAHAAALATTAVTPLAGGTLAVQPYLQTAVAGLDPNAGGLVDVANGRVTVAAGLSGADTVVALLAGRGDGAWSGTSGITSSVVAAEVAASEIRAVGWLDNGDGSITVAYAAQGDTNLDWLVDILDVSNFVAAGKFGTGAAATWYEGDFNYDGTVDIQDVADFSATGLYGAPGYNTAPPPAVGVAVVPEPAPSAVAVAVCGALAAVRGLRGSRRSVAP